MMKGIGWERTGRLAAAISVRLIQALYRQVLSAYYLIYSAFRAIDVLEKGMMGRKAGDA
jgi:hypothetical protein